MSFLSFLSSPLSCQCFNRRSIDTLPISILGEDRRFGHQMASLISDRKISIQCMKPTIPSCFNQIPPSFIFRNAHVTLVKRTGLVSLIHWSEIFVFLSVSASTASASTATSASVTDLTASPLRSVQDGRPLRQWCPTLCILNVQIYILLPQISTSARKKRMGAHDWFREIENKKIWNKNFQAPLPH